MKLRPTIFLSGVSSEFASFRDAVAQEILKKGCYPHNQPTFGVDWREIETILREKLREADAVIHIVGFRLGDEPKGRPHDKPRRSYTQLEFDIARELEKPIYLFLSNNEAGLDEKPEDAESTALQLAHRQSIQNGNYLYHDFEGEVELCKLVAEIPLIATVDFRVDISRIDKNAPAELIGRNGELALLNDAWLKVRNAEAKRPHILTFVALGGEGKTSLVAKWLADLAFQNWPGCDSAFAWSFYSQGTREQFAASSDLFLKEAITFFGNEDDAEFAASSSGAYEKGQRLARIVGRRRSLLILDGLEPLQHAPTSPTSSELKDSGLAALLKGLAAYNDGLCIVTTRYSLPDLKVFWQTTSPEVRLLSLSSDAGVHLLKTLGVKGMASELKTLVADVKGHALTLNLLGTYLRDAHGGDIRQRDLVKLEEADAEEQGGHAFRVIEAYEEAFDNEGEKGKRALAILRLLGLFDRPVSADCLAALLKEPAIPGLTDPIVQLSEPQRNLALKRLEDANLITINRELSGAFSSIDAHPLLREYFSNQLRTQQPDGWRAAHRRVYEHLRDTTPDKPQPTLEDLQPLYQAITHGCQAGLQQKTRDEVYFARITRREEFYSVKKLGAFASELGAVASFFKTPWSRVSPALNEADQAWLLNVAAFSLRSVGRLTEAIEPMRAALQMRVKQENWKAAVRVAGNLSQLELTLGKVVEAIRNAKHFVIYADRSGNTFERIISRTTIADALHQAGRTREAEVRFREAEQMQKEMDPKKPLLVSLRGFQYCDLLLAVPERVAWQFVERQQTDESSDNSQNLKALRTVSRRAAWTLKWAEVAQGSLLTVALDHLTLSRAALYETVLTCTVWPIRIESSKLKVALDESVNRLRRSGNMDDLPRSLLTRAWLRCLSGAQTGSGSSQEDLEEAWEIAERGPMKLFIVDIHLYRARLFFREPKYPWESARKDLEEAERLINECSYHRRDEELADAKRVILGQSV